MTQYFEMEDPFRTIPRPPTGEVPIPKLDVQTAPSYDAEVRQRLAAMRTATGGAGAAPPAPPTPTVAPAGAPQTPETAARKPPGKLAKAGGALAIGGAIANQMTGGNPLATAGMAAMGAAPFSGPLAPVVGGTGALLTTAGAVQEATGIPTFTSDGARRFDSQIMAPLRRLFSGPEVRGPALSQPQDVPVTESVVQKDVPAAPVAAAPAVAPSSVPDPLAAPTIGAYRDPANYAPVLAAVGGRIPTSGGAAPVAVQTMGGNAFGIDPNAVRTNTVQAVKAADGSTVYTNFAAPGTTEAANASAAAPAQFERPSVGGVGVQGRGVQGVVDSILGLGAIRTARADEMVKAKLQNDYRTAVATQALKNQAALADRDKPIKVTLPGFAEGVYSRRDQTVTTFGADGTATTRSVQSAPPPLSEGSVRAINRQLLEANPGSSLAQRRAKLEEIYGKGKIEDAWLR